MTGMELAEAARTLVGTAFQLHGRDPMVGLDCVGVLSAACAALGHPARLPNGYPLRMCRMPEVSGLVASLGLKPASGVILAGDVLILRPSSCQFHLAIAADGRTVIHAHAGLRKVVVSPLDGWPVAAHWRLQPPNHDR